MAEILRGIPVETPPSPQASPPPLEEGFAEGFARGFSEGKASGEEEGRALGQQAFADVQTALREVLTNLCVSQETARLALREELADLVLPLVTPLFIELAHNREWLNTRIEHLLAHLHTSETLTLFLHPTDIHRLQENDCLQALPPKVEVRADESLRLGGCRLHSEHGLLDAGIEAQIDRLKVLLLKRREEIRHD